MSKAGSEQSERNARLSFCEGPWFKTQRDPRKIAKTQLIFVPLGSFNFVDRFLGGDGSAQKPGPPNEPQMWG
jgi:hypothetical protein